MPETLALAYKTLDESEQKEVLDFVNFIIYRRRMQKKDSSNRIAAIEKYAGCCKGIWQTDALEYQNELRAERENG